MSDLIKDLRVNLNRAQESGQEALKNVERAKFSGQFGSTLTHFDDEAYRFATEAAHHAITFAALCQEAAREFQLWQIE